jgi:sirohydrochlorin ferrochelatase
MSSLPFQTRNDQVAPGRPLITESKAGYLDRAKPLRESCNMRDVRPSLVIVAHGSKSDGWSQLVELFVAEVRATPGVADAFSGVHAAYLEHSQPRLAPTVRLAFETGAREVLVLPLFLTYSVHAAEDVPAILGLDVPAHVRQRLVAEGHDVLYPGLPLRLLELDEKNEVLAANVVFRVSGSSKPSGKEAVVLCGYGSNVYHETWETLMGDLRRRLMEKGYGYVDRAYVGHSVANSSQPTEDAILKAAGMAGIETIFVVPLLLSASNLQHGSIAQACAKLQSETEYEIRYTADSILPDSALAARISGAALRSIGVYATSETGVLA